MFTVKNSGVEKRQFLKKIAENVKKEEPVIHKQESNKNKNIIANHYPSSKKETINKKK